MAKINAWHPANNHSSKKNFWLNIILGIVSSLEKQHKITQVTIKKRLITAVEQLDHPVVDVRLAEILELAELVTSHSPYIGEIREILTAFVRKNSPLQIDEAAESITVFNIQPDIQASLNVIAKTDCQQYLEAEPIDLSYTDLRKTNLTEANLAGANLYRVNLSGANLAGANLAGAILSAANLSNANLAGANLTEAILSAANLSQANLANTKLLRANFYLANLSQANLQNAILDGANFREAKFSG